MPLVDIATINHKFRSLTRYLSEEVDTNVRDIKILPVEPLFQRKLFLQKSLDNDLNIFVQLNPVSSDGRIVNIRGKLRKIGYHRYLLTNGKVNYIFTLDQLRYITA